MTESPHLLIVDDVAQNIQILATMLTVDPYRISFAQRGITALELLEKERFDLILLDVQMPEMSGFEVCKAIKALPHLSDIPIIFLTAYAAPQQSVLGFQAGAVDYITKPVEPLELRARVKTHLELKRARDQILAQNKDLQQLNYEKSQLLRFVSHDLRNPLTILSAGLDFLDDKLLPTTESIQRRLLNMRVAIGRMSSIIEHFLDREVIQQGAQRFTPTRFSLADFMQDLYLHHESAADERYIKLKVERKDWMLYTDRVALQQILDNLISNAIKYAPVGSRIEVGVVRQHGACIFNVLDEGNGFNHQWLKAPDQTREQTGLGLRIVHKMTTLLRGTLMIQQRDPQGTEIEVSIPMEEPLSPRS